MPTRIPIVHLSWVYPVLSSYLFLSVAIGKATGVVAGGCRCGKALAATMRVKAVKEQIIEMAGELLFT